MYRHPRTSEALDDDHPHADPGTAAADRRILARRELPVSRQNYLRDNPLLRRPLTLDDVKPTLLGHWGTTPGQNFIYVHLNRVICKYDVDMIYVSRPGHGG